MKEIESLVGRVFDEAVRAAVMDVIADKVGSGVDSEIKQSIKETAMQMLKSDPKLRQMIRNAMISWIKRQEAP